MLANYTSTLHAFLESTLKSNKSTEDIKEIMWNSNSKFDLITFRRDSQIVDKKGIQPDIT